MIRILQTLVVWVALLVYTISSVDAYEQALVDKLNQYGVIQAAKTGTLCLDVTGTKVALADCRSIHEKLVYSTATQQFLSVSDPTMCFAIHPQVIGMVKCDTGHGLHPLSVLDWVGAGSIMSTQGHGCLEPVQDINEASGYSLSVQACDSFGQSFYPIEPPTSDAPTPSPVLHPDAQNLFNSLTATGSGDPHFKTWSGDRYDVRSRMHNSYKEQCQWSVRVVRFHLNHFLYISIVSRTM